MKHINLFFIGLVSSSFIYAEPSITTSPDKNWTWVGSISGGSLWEKAGKTQTFYLAPEIEKTYAAKRATQMITGGELFLGVQKKLPFKLQGQLGLAIAETSSATLSGNIWDDGDPSFNNYHYQYQIQHRHVAVKGKLLADQGYWLIPWVSASLGIGFNHAHGFTNTPSNDQAIQTPNFAAHTQTSFTYTLGFGVQKPLNEHLQIGVGYEFADWGKSKLDRAAGQTLNAGPSLNHLYTNSVMCNLTYIA